MQESLDTGKTFCRPKLQSTIRKNNIFLYYTTAVCGNHIVCDSIIFTAYDFDILHRICSCM